MNKWKQFWQKHIWLNEMKENLRIIFGRPLMTILKIPANLLEMIYQNFPVYVISITKAFGRVLCFPFNLLIGFTHNLEGTQVRIKVQIILEKGIAFVRNTVKKKTNGKSVKRKMKIYCKVVDAAGVLEDSFLGTYYQERIFCFLALLLQTVSFFTTYGGTNLYFGSIADTAPLFVALPIQAGLYFCITNAFRYGKKVRTLVAMFFLWACSTFFSYTGLIVVNLPPQQEYEMVYDAYVKMFEYEKQQLLDSFDEKEQVMEEIAAAFDKLESNSKQLAEEIQRQQKVIDNFEFPEKMLTDTTIIRTADGSTTEKIVKPNPDYERAEIAFDNLKEEQARLIRYNESISAFVNNVSKDKVTALLTGVYETEDETALEEWTSFCKNLENALNENNELEIAGIGMIEIPQFTVYDKELRDREIIETITLPSYSEVVTGTPGEKSRIIQRILEAAKEMLGSDLGESMKQVEIERAKICKAVKESFNSMKPYLNGREISEQLELCRNEVLALPDVYSYALSMLMEESSKKAAGINFLFALFTDALSVLFGWLAAKKHAAFLYVKSSKDYYSDIDNLFSMVFRSLQSSKLMKIEANTYQNLSDEEFRFMCMSYVNQLNCYISDFLDKFSFSECTTEEGFDMCWHYYEGDKEIEKYKPIISALNKTNLIRTLPAVAYTELELDYHFRMEVSDDAVCGVKRDELEQYEKKLAEAKSKGYVLLLKSRGENYMREHITGRLVWEGDAP